MEAKRKAFHLIAESASRCAFAGHCCCLWHAMFAVHLHAYCFMVGPPQDLYRYCGFLISFASFSHSSVSHTEVF